MILESIGELVERVEKRDPSASREPTFTYIDLSSVDRDGKAISEPSQLAPSDAPSRARQVVAVGDVLVSTVRPNLNAVASVGRAYHGAIASTGFCVLRPGPNICGDYLFHWVRSERFVNEMTRLATGASYPAVTDRIVKDSQIPLPSLEEQKRIAAILDAADNLRTKRRQALTKLDTLTQAIFHDMFGDPSQNVASWDVAVLGDLLTGIDSGKSPVCLDRPADPDEWGVLKAGAVTYCEFDSGETKALPTEIEPTSSTKCGLAMFCLLERTRMISWPHRVRLRNTGSASDERPHFPTRH